MIYWFIYLYIYLLFDCIFKSIFINMCPFIVYFQNFFTNLWIYFNFYIHSLLFLSIDISFVRLVLVCFESILCLLLPVLPQMQGFFVVLCCCCFLFFVFCFFCFVFFLLFFVFVFCILFSVCWVGPIITYTSLPSKSSNLWNRPTIPNVSVSLFGLTWPSFLSKLSLVRMPKSTI